MARLDVPAALAFYVGLGPAERSYLKVSREFQVSLTTIQKWGKRQDWPSKAAAADADASEKGQRQAARSRADRVATTLKFVDDYTDAVKDRLAGNALDVKASDVAALVKLAELLTGEPTDRIQISQLQPLLDSYDLALDQLTILAKDPEKAAAIVRRLDDDLLAFAATARSRERL